MSREALQPYCCFFLENGVSLVLQQHPGVPNISIAHVNIQTSLPLSSAPLLMPRIEGFAKTELGSILGFFFRWWLVIHVLGFSIALILAFSFSSQDNYRNCFLRQFLNTIDFIPAGSPNVSAEE